MRCFATAPRKKWENTGGLVLRQHPRTADGGYEALNYHRFADDIVITVRGHHTERGWAERALQRLREQIEPLGVHLNTEKTKIVDTLCGEALGLLGFEIRRVRSREGRQGYILLAPKKKARIAIKAGFERSLATEGRRPPRVSQKGKRRSGWVGGLFPGGQREPCLQ